MRQAYMRVPRLNPFIVHVFFMCISFSPALALEPSQVLVLANTDAESSEELALYYMERRRIPPENLVLLSITDQETCLRQAYEMKVLPKIREALAFNPSVRAIVTMYGLPLKIASPGPTPKEQQELERLFSGKEQLPARVENTSERTSFDASNDRPDTTQNQIHRREKRIRDFKIRTDKAASFDSELMLSKNRNYPLNYWLPNPCFAAGVPRDTRFKESDVLMVSRLDGADEPTVRRIIDDSLYAEKMGLTGTAYFDARWEKPDNPDSLSGYALYDDSIHKAAAQLSATGKIKVELDDRQALFQKGDCPDTALYCGWYSVANYIDAFTWQRGSVGFHIASHECRTLKEENSNIWCKKMLEKGIAATVGPVEEPFVQSFPRPDIFFDLLAQGELTLAEAYLASLPYLSWKMVLVGDPLYKVNLK